MTNLSQQLSSRLTPAPHRRACSHASFQYKGLVPPVVSSLSRLSSNASCTPGALTPKLVFHSSSNLCKSAERRRLLVPPFIRAGNSSSGFYPWLPSLAQNRPLLSASTQGSCRRWSERVAARRSFDCSRCVVKSPEHIQEHSTSTIRSPSVRTGCDLETCRLAASSG